MSIAHLLPSVKCCKLAAAVLQGISQKLQPFRRDVADAKARQSEPTAEHDMLAQRHATALKAFQVCTMQQLFNCA